MNRHCVIFNSQCFHYVRCNKCSNIEMFKFLMLEFNVEMFECFNALKLAEYCVFFCLFFLHIVVLFVLKMLVAGKRKYTHKTLREKCQALKDLEKGESNRGVATEYNVPKDTLSTWVKNKERLFDALKKGTNFKRQKLKSGNQELVDQANFNWFLNMQSQNVLLSASMIQEKAVIFAKELNTENFQASDGLLRRWKERDDISFKTVSGASKSVTPEIVNAWSQTSLPTLLSNYDLKDICNADEFGLFYPCLPNKTYQLKSEKCYGGKLNKIHITGMAAANAMDDKLPMFVIEKAKNSRCF